MSDKATLKWRPQTTVAPDREGVPVGGNSNRRVRSDRNVIGDSPRRSLSDWPDDMVSGGGNFRVAFQRARPWLQHGWAVGVVVLGVVVLSR